MRYFCDNLWNAIEIKSMKIISLSIKLIKHIIAQNVIKYVLHLFQKCLIFR